MDRRTVTRRIAEAGVPPADERRGHPVYELRRVLPVLYAETVARPGTSPDDMLPTDRRAWFQSENERIRLEKELRQLLPAHDVAREMAQMARQFTNSLETIPDLLERDCGLNPLQVDTVFEVLDSVRDYLYQVMAEDLDTESGAEK
ncbi:MAG: terminase small subunit [Haliea sp.]|nr:terminase small subunit [Haliea sp.]